jgi:hypothetical protein
MTPNQKKHALTRDLLLSSVVVAMGLGLSGISLERLARPHSQLAQATPPLQSTPDAQDKPSSPAEPTTTGSRPGAIAPQPARPDDEAQKAGARPALPQAPAEQIGTPIRDR